MEDYTYIKNSFYHKFQSILESNLKFKEVIYELFFSGSAYIVGGFLRDIIFNKASRDLDMIIDLPFEMVKEVLNHSTISYKLNRLNGFKLSLSNIEVDLWCIDDNWAFKQNLVHKNEENLLESIANGCFYNHDALVINAHKLNMNIRHFNKFLKTRELDIIQKNNKYKELNPTIEGNILRAFYLRKLYGIRYTENCNNYLISRIGFLNDKYGSAIERLIDYKSKYPKYNKLLVYNELFESINYCKNNTKNLQLIV